MSRQQSLAEGFSCLLPDLQTHEHLSHVGPGKKLTDCELLDAIDARVRFGAAYLAAEVLRGVKSMRVEFGAGPRDHCWLALVALQGSAKTLRIMLFCLVWAWLLLQLDHRPQDWAPAERQ